MGVWGAYIYKLYNYDLPSSTDKTKHPYVEWTYVSYALAGPAAFYIFFWLFNYLIGNNGNWFDWLTVAVTNLNRLSPFAGIAAIFYASS